MNKISEKTVLILRIMIAAYLIYLSYDLLTDVSSSEHFLLVIIAGVIFGIVGVIITALSAWKLWKMYKANRMDDYDFR